MKFMMSLHGLRHHWEASFFVRVLKRIDPNKIIEGFEVNGNPDDPYDRDYIYTLARLMKSDPRTLQFHSHFDLHNHYDNLDYLNDTLKFYNEISSILGYDISIVLHPVDSFDIEVSMSRTRRYINNMMMLKKINRYKVHFTLENLNNTLQHNRINTPEVQALLETQPDLGFCWDIGHEVSEDICTYKLNSSLVNTLSNVHIHDIYKKDHYPFDYGRTDYKRSIDYLSSLNYDGSVIVEINLDYLEGNSLLEKFRRYMENIDKLKSYYQTIHQVSNEKQLI